MTKKQERERRTRPSVLARVRAECDRATLAVCRIEARGCRRLVVEGCERILDYGECCICLAVRDPDARYLVVRGRDLRCLSYHPNAVILEGRMEAVLWQDGEPNGEDGGSDRQKGGEG